MGSGAFWKPLTGCLSVLPSRIFASLSPFNPFVSAGKFMASKTLGPYSTLQSAKECDSARIGPRLQGSRDPIVMF